MSYEKQSFENDKTVLTAEHLNHIEEGIVNIEQQIENSEIIAILSDDGLISFKIRK
jgi:hypothetical protein